ncbi:hypothetical protein, partial [Vibrio nigripulchritudo]|uniref:hypothetical protein n=1 Tax=Vibrio nigripulchritudo TaxID=28173 RepID=UPI001E5DFA8C
PPPPPTMEAPMADNTKRITVLNPTAVNTALLSAPTSASASASSISLRIAHLRPATVIGPYAERTGTPR